MLELVGVAQRSFVLICVCMIMVGNKQRVLYRNVYVKSGSIYTESFLTHPVDNVLGLYMTEK